MSETLVSYGGGEILKSVFTAVSMLIYGKQESFFRPLMLVAASVGGFWAICQAFATHASDALIKRYVLPLIAVSSLLIIPETKLNIEDVVSGRSYTVSRVPMFLARFAEVTSTIGYRLTSGIESVMHTPQATSYNATGMLFGSEASMDFNRYEITDADFKGNLQEFVGQCVVYDVALGQYSIGQLRTTSDLWGFLEKHTSSVRMMPYTALRGEGSHKGSLLDGTRNITCQEAAKRMAPLFGREMDWYAKQEIASHLPMTFQALTGLQKSKRELIGQQLMMGFLAGELGGDKFAALRAGTQQKNTYQVMGALAGKSLVTIRIVFEALIYAVFILVLPLSVLPGGLKFLMTWGGMVLWTQLWPPLYAILNYIMQVVAQTKTAAIFANIPISEQTLTFFTQAGLQNLYSDVFALAGYLSASIPFLSYAILKGGVGSFIHLAGAMMTPAHAAAGAAAAEQATGNYSFANTSVGQTSFSNTTAFQRNLAPSLSAGFMSVNRGTSSVVYGADETILRQANSELRQGVFGDSSVSESAQIAQQHALSHAEQSGRHLQESLSEHSRDFSEYASHLANSESLGDSFSEREAHELQESARYVENVSANWGEQYGLSRRESMELLGSVAAGGSAGLNMPFLKAHLGGDARWSRANHASRDDMLSSALQVARSEDFQKNYQEVVGSGQTHSHSLSKDQGQRLATSMSHSLDQVSSSQRTWQQSQSTLEQFSNAVSTSSQHSTQVRSALNQEFINWASSHYADQGGFDFVEDRLNRGTYAQREEILGAFVDQYRVDQQGFFEAPSRDVPDRIRPTGLSGQGDIQRVADEHKREIHSLAYGAGLDGQSLSHEGASLRDRSLKGDMRAAAQSAQNTIGLEDQRLMGRLSDRQQQSLSGEGIESLKNAIGRIRQEEAGWAQASALAGRWRVSDPGLTADTEKESAETMP